MLCTLLSLEESHSICETDDAAYYGTNLKTQLYPTVSHSLVLVRLATEIFQEIHIIANISSSYLKNNNKFSTMTTQGIGSFSGFNW